MVFDEGTNPSQWQLRVQDKWKKVQNLSKKGMGYGASIISADRCVSCTTFNILAPIYKRLDEEDPSCRESQYRARWLNRNQSIVDRLLLERSSIICLQEVWLGNDELVGMYEKSLGDAGYIILKLARTNDRGDGLLAAINRECFRILNYQEMLFNDFADRVAQLLHVEPVVPLWQSGTCNVQQVLIVNTHLLFPHNYTFCIVRLRQVYKILQCIETYQKEHKLSPMPVILCGDWNGSKRGHVYKFLSSQGFMSSYDVAHQHNDSDADTDNVWVSHRNHRGNICGVDFIWLFNPCKHRKPLRSSWNETLFEIVEYLLRQASLAERNAFTFLKADNPGGHITFASFCQALCQLGLTGHPNGLNAEEMEDLWLHADIDGKGYLEYGEFEQRIWNAKCLEKSEKMVEESEVNHNMNESKAFGFIVKSAALFPPEVEKGVWPENYFLSDHAPLTVLFSPVRML